MELCPVPSPILCYHHIVQDRRSEAMSHLAVSVSRFERQIQYLRCRGYRCVPLANLAQCSENARPEKQRVFALSFDDGYSDFLTNAFPILQRYGCTATIFLVVGRVGEPSDWAGASGAPLLTWQQVQALDRQGISFGSHTLTHPRLTGVPPDQVWRELTVSKAQLEARLGHEVTLFAYPYGVWDGDIPDKVKAAGYQAACGVSQGAHDQFNLLRYQVLRDDRLPAFAFKLTRWSDLRRWFREETAVGRFLHREKARWVQRQSAAKRR